MFQLMFFSELSMVVSGVPQGTVLALQLVNVSLMMSNYIATLNSLMILLLVTTDNLKNHLASALLEFEGWSQVWQLRVNVSKCSVLHRGLHNPLFTYTLNAKPLPTADCVRDLGVTYDNKIRFDDYIYKIVSKAFQYNG